MLSARLVQKLFTLNEFFVLSQGLKDNMVWHFQQTINTTGRVKRVCSGQYNWWLKEAPMARSDTGISLLALLAISTDREGGIKIEISSLIRGNCEEHEKIAHHAESVRVLKCFQTAYSTFQL